MSSLYVAAKAKPRLEYYGLTLQDAVKLLDWYVSNYDSDELCENSIFRTFYVRLKADTESDEYRFNYAGTYSVEFRDGTYGGDADGLAEVKPWDRSMKQFEALRKLIQHKFELE